MCICMHMTKIISITNSVYEKLKRLKKGRSFSQEIDELVENAASSKKGDLKELFKYAGILSDEEAEELRKIVAEGRKNAKARVFKSY